MADGEQEGKTEIQKFEYLESEKSFLNEINSVIKNVPTFTGKHLYQSLFFK